MYLVFGIESVNISVITIPFSKSRVSSNPIYSVYYIRSLVRLLHLFEMASNHLDLLSIYLLR
jgi:hypothetical protein